MVWHKRTTDGGVVIKVPVIRMLGSSIKCLEETLKKQKDLLREIKVRGPREGDEFFDFTDIDYLDCDNGPERVVYE